MPTTTRRKPTAKRSTKEVGGAFPAASLYGQHKRKLAIITCDGMHPRWWPFVASMAEIVQSERDNLRWTAADTKDIKERDQYKQERDRIARRIRKARRLILAVCQDTQAKVAEQRQRAENRRSRQLRLAFAI